MLEAVSKRMDKRALILSAFLIAGIAIPFLWPDRGSAKGVYVYKDRKGVVHFTDAPTESGFRLVKIMAGGGMVKRRM